MVLLCCVSVQLKADELTVNDGTATNLYVPLYGFYADTSGKSQFVVSSDDLSGVGSISGLKFYAASDFSFTGTWEVRLMETAETSVSSSFLDVTNATLVYTGTIVISGGEASITFADNFTYANGENLLIEVSLKTTGNCSSSSAPVWYGVSTGTSRGGSGSSPSSRNFLPKVTFVYTPGSGSTCEKPTAFEVADVTAEGASFTWSGGSGTYNLEYKKTSADKWTVALESTTLTSHTLTGLESNTAYQVRVNCVCGSETSSYKSASFTTAIALPYEEPFNGTSTPDGWSRYYGIMNTDGSVTLTQATYSYWNFGEGSSYGSIFGSSHAYGSCQYYSSSSYHKWLVSPVLPMEEGLQLSFDLALTNSSGNAVTAGNQSGFEFVVLYSTDGGLNWIELRRWNNSGSSYVFDNISSTGEEVELDLSALTSGTAQFAFYLIPYSSATSSSVYIHIDNVRVGAVPACKKPTGLAEAEGKTTKNSIQVDWTPVTSETAWKVQYKKASDSEWIVLDAPAHPFTLSGLLEFTEYNIRVAADCGEELKYSSPITVKTAAGVPFEQSFSVSSVPSEWKRYTGLWEDVQNGGDLTAANAGWSTVYYSNTNANGVFPDSTYHLYLNVAGTDCKSWLVSPIIEMEAGYQLTFNLSLTPKSATSPAGVTAGQQTDDQFILAINEGDGWTALRTWDNSGSAFDNIKGTASGELIKVALDAYAGKAIQLAFYGESTEANGDNNLHIQNVKIATVPACENTTSLEVSAVDVTTASLVWAQEEGATWEYYYRVKPTEAFTPTDENFTHSTTAYSVDLSELSENTSYVFYLRRACSETEHSEIRSIEFSTYAAPKTLPWSENFNAAGFPELWDNTEGTTTSASYRWNKYLVSEGDSCLRFNSYNNSNGNTNILATPRIDLSEAAILSFDWKNPTGGAGEVLISNDGGATRTSLLSTGLTGVSEWTPFEINLSDYEGQKVIIYFKGTSNYGNGDAYLYLDNVKVDAAPDCLKPNGLAVEEVTENSALLAWADDNDGNIWAWAKALASETEPELTEYVDIDQTSKLIEGLQYNTAYTFYLRKHCSGGYSEAVSVSFKTVNPYEVTINNGTTTSSYIPFYGYYADNYLTYSQFIIPADSLTALQWDTIQSLTFYLSSPASKDFDPDRFSVFMKEVPATTMSALTDTATMTKVVNAKAVVIADSKMTIELDEAFPYADGNLLIAFNQTVNGTYASTSWYGKSASSGSSMYGYGTYSPSSQYFLPKMTIEFKEGETPACVKPSALDTITDGVTTSSIAIEWTPGSQEQYWFVQYKKAADEEWIFVADSVKTPSYTITGLDASSLYNIRVASWCNPADSTDHTDYCMITRATECEAITSFPYEQNFNSLTSGENISLPCWGNEHISGSGTYLFQVAAGSNASATTNVGKLPDMSSGTITELSLPEMAIPAINAYEFFISVYRNATGTNYPEEGLRILVAQGANTTELGFIARNITTTDTINQQEVVPAESAAGWYRYNFTIPVAGNVNIIVRGESKFGSATYFDDLLIREIPACLEPSAVEVVNATATSVQFTYTAREVGDSLSYAIALKGAEPAEFTGITTDTVLVEGLDASSEYVLYVRTECANSASPSISAAFQTMQLPATMPYVNDFESGCDWQFINGTLTNAWVYGEAAHNGDGTHALYVSSDAGVTHAYTNSSSTVVYAVRLFNFETGNYQFSYDWLANGESSWDYLRVALVPASVELTAGTSLPTGVSSTALPDGWIALDGGSQRQGKTEWQSFESAVIPVTAGLYNVVLLWRNDGSGGSNPPAAVDNFSIEKLSCLPPTNLAAALTSGNGTTATLSWTAGESESAWVLEYSTKADMSDSISLEVNNTPSKDLAGLTAETTYYARVKAVCSANDESSWSSVISFTPTNALELTINRGTQTNNLVPVASNYLYTYNYENGSRSQFIIPADSLTAVQWGKIKQLTFFSSSAAFSFGNATFEAYMETAPATTFASDAFVNWTSLTKVMNAASLAVEGNKMVVTLDEPYDYTGGDLLIGIKSVASAYISSSCNWQGVTATNAAVASGYVYDYYYDEYYEEIARQNFLPQMAISYLEGEEPSCLKPTGLTVSYNGGDSAIVNWTSDAASWNLDVNGVVTAVSAKPYTIHGLSLATAYAVKVQAVCGPENLSEWTSAQNFATDVCNAEDQQSIRYELTDSYGDGWNGGATLKVVHKATSKEVASLTIASGSSKSGTVALCCGEEYSFVWVAGSYDSECRFSIYDVDDAVIIEHTTSTAPTAGTLLDYTMVCPTCIKPTGVVIPDSTITATTAVVHWTAGHSSQTVWQLAYDTLQTLRPDTLPTYKAEVTAIPDTLKELLPEHQYFVYVRAYCGPNDSSKWADVKSFTTASLCQKPDGLAKAGASVSTLTISWNTYGQTDFNLRYGTDGTNWTVVNGIATSPYTIEGLNASTAYYVQVQAACAAAQENSWTTSLIAKTAYGIPFEEKFAATTTPTDWTRYSGALAEDGTASLTTASGGWNFGTANGIFDSHARVNIYYYAANWWMVTPAIELTANTQLTFDLALTKYSPSTPTAVDTTLQDGHCFEVLISTNGGANWTVLRKWSNEENAEYKYNDIATEGELVTLNLSAYAGQSVQVAFYGSSEGISASGDNNLHVDNVLIDLIPSCLKPTKVNVADVKAHSAQISWTAGEEGQDTWQVVYDTLPSNRPDTLPNYAIATENPYELSGLDPEHTYYIYVRAICAVGDSSKFADVKSFTTTVACPAPTLTAHLTPGNGAVAGLKWNGGDAESYTVQYGTDNTFADYTELVDVTIDTLALEGLTAEATYYARVKANCGIDGESEWSAIISFVPTNKYQLLINDGTATNEYVPVYGYYADNLTRSQFIIPAATLEPIQWDTIKHLTFYTSSPASVNFGAATFEVFVAEVDETTFASTTLYDWAEMDTVMAAASLSISGNKMEVAFSKPYQYQDGNLMIGIKQGVKGNDTHTYWYGITATGTSLSGYQGTSLSISQRNFLPKMLIEYVPGVEPACKDPKHLKLDDVTAHTATFSWDAVEGADWRYVVAPKGEEFGPIQRTEENTVTVENLDESTEYVFYLSRYCDEEHSSNTITIEFMTEAHAAGMPFADDFEGVNYWKFGTSQASAWVIGEAASNGGSKSLYISNDGGENNAYDHAVESASFATMLINLDKDTTYVISYDWRCAGDSVEEDGALDYMRVGLVLATTAVTDGSQSLPAGWIALDGGPLANQDTWQHKSLEVELVPGQYKIVIAWFNDYDDEHGEDPAGAIDNFSIEYKRGSATGLNEGMLGGDKAIKFIQNNHVYILVNGRIYDATGRRVE